MNHQNWVEDATFWPNSSLHISCIQARIHQEEKSKYFGSVKFIFSICIKRKQKIVYCIFSSVNTITWTSLRFFSFPLKNTRNDILNSSNKFIRQFPTPLLLLPTSDNLTVIFQPTGDAGGLPMQIGNKTECALLGFVIDLGVDYRQVSSFTHYSPKMF